MRGWPRSLALQLRERLLLAVIFAALLVVLAGRCRRLRTEQPDFVPPAEAAEN